MQTPQKMDDSPQLYNSEFGDGDDIEEEDIYQEETNMEPEAPNSCSSDLHEHPVSHTERGWDSFPCQDCKRHFTSKQGLERHMHIHTLVNNQAHTHKNNGNPASGSNLGQPPLENMKFLDSESSDTQQPHTSSPASSKTSILSAGDGIAQTDEQRALQEQHVCKYCEKRFTTLTDKRQHEHRIHKQHLEKTQAPREESLKRKFTATLQQETELCDNAAPAAVLDNEGEPTEQYMLDVSSNSSENLSFYIDGKIVSTSTVSGCEAAAEVHSGSSASAGLDSLILDPTQISQILNTDSATGKEIPGQAPAKRRTATPPLLPQIKTELESEVVISSSSSSLVSCLIDKSTAVPKERTLFLSPKLKQLLEKQDGLKPTLALITDGKKPGSPVSLSVLPAGTGRFKRRTGSPQTSPQKIPVSSEETAVPDSAGCDAAGVGQKETQQSSPTPQTANENDGSSQFGEEKAVIPVLTESWAPATGGNSCNQQPLDLSNTVKRNADGALSDAVLDLSVPKRSQDESELVSNLVVQAVLQAEGKSKACTVESIREQNVRPLNPDTPVVTDFTLVTGSDMVESVAEGLVYGLALPPGSLTPAPAALAPVALQPAAPCTIAFASPAPHAVLPAAPSLITVLASPPPPPPISNPSSQPIQVLAPNISPEPLVICTENALNSSECNLATAFTANSASLVTLSQPLEPTLNLPSHVFLTEQIALNPPTVESTAVSELPFTPAVTLNDSLINSYNITSNTVLIECTIALESPGSVVPAAITLQEGSTEPPVPTQMVVNHIEQQQIVSVPNPAAVEPTVLVSSIAESVTMSATTSVITDCSTVDESSPDPEPAVKAEPPNPKEEAPADSSASTAKVSGETPPRPEKTEEEEAPNAPSDTQQQTFTKNFVCNVCDKLFHSMKELGHHVGDHADEWPYKCEFCVLLFDKPSALLDHRSSLHGVGKTYVCSACTKDFVYLCNLKQHQEELHPSQQCTYTEEEKGKIRPQNYNNSKVSTEPSVPDTSEEPRKPVKKEENQVDVTAEELLTTIKIMASDGGKLKGPDVRLGINQHYPSFKPPPFPYHNRSRAGSLASATNFTTHNIPQTFSTAIRCTKCGKSFDNMPELHKHILACANASDKKRYTPKKNPIPLRHFAKTQNGVLATTNSANEFNASNRASQSNKSKPNEETPVKMKFRLSKRKKKLVQRVLPQRGKSASSSNKVSPDQQEVFVCPHCRREFTMRRSRTKHMAVCPKKPKERKKRNEGGISVTKENDGRLHRGASRIKEKQQQASPPHKTRLQTSGLAKRPAILPVQTVFSNKRSKIIIKESTQPVNKPPTLNDLPMVRTFSSSMRQYTRVQHSVKGIPIKITIVNPSTAETRKEELLPTLSREEAAAAAAGGSGHSATA